MNSDPSSLAGPDNAGPPLVTLVVLVFNQQNYIREAVKSALSQTYRPLEIILSDDCSTDDSFEVMRQIAGEYDGSHRIILNKNVKNLGLAEHINQVARLSAGSIIVFAAGDDISLPHRVESIVAEFSRSENVRAVFSGYTKIGASGEVVGEVLLPQDTRFFTGLEQIAKAGGWAGLGATFAYHRECFTSERPIPREIICEDRLLPFRAALLGTVAYVSEPLILYRVHDESITAGARFETPQYDAVHLRILMNELEWASGSQLIDPLAYSRTKRALTGWPKYIARSRRYSRHRLLARIHYAWYHSDVWRRRLLARLSGLRKPVLRGESRDTNADSSTFR
jgi:glycosyltransferase involved in cell wall biosynthesis